MSGNLQRKESNMYGLQKWPNGRLCLQWEPKCGTLDGHGPRQGLKALLEYYCSSRITGSARHAFAVLLGTQLATASEANFHCHLAVTLIFAQSWHQSRATSRSVPNSNLQITPHDTQWLKEVEKCHTACINHFILVSKAALRSKGWRQVRDNKSLGQGAAERQSGKNRAEDTRDSSCLSLCKSYFLHANSTRVLTWWYVIVRSLS